MKCDALIKLTYFSNNLPQLLPEQWDTTHFSNNHYSRTTPSHFESTAPAILPNPHPTHTGGKATI